MDKKGGRSLNTADQKKAMEFLTRSQNMIQGYAYSIVRDFHLAEDVYQEVAMIVLERWSSLEKGPKLKSWVCEVARRKALEVLRKNESEVQILPEETLEELGPCFEEESPAVSGNRDPRDVISECVEELAEPARRITDAKYRDNLPCGEIAELVGRSIQSVYSILKKARVLLAECYDRKIKESAA